MAYESTKVVKTLRFPGDTANQYQINAVRLDGHTYSEIDDRFKTIEQFDALRYMGTIAGSTTAPGGLTVAANKGDVYKVTTKGYVMGAKVEVGDMLICNTDGTAAATSTNYTTVAANWDIIQSNVDVDALLAHHHTGNVTFSKSNKTVTHTVTPTKTTITGSFSGGTASVNGEHTHTASGSFDYTPDGSVADTSITPDGTVKLTAPTSAGTNDVTLTTGGTVNAAATKYVTSVVVEDHAAHTHTGTTGNASDTGISGSVTIKTGTGTANYTPSGTVGNSSTAVTDVEAGSTTVSSHEASSGNAGGFTPAGTVTINAYTPEGSVASHKHSVALSKKTGTHTAVASVTTTYTAGATADDGVLTIGTTSSSGTFLTSETGITETSVAPTFTGTAKAPTGSFSGTAVAAHSHTITVEDHEEFIPVISVTKGNHNHSFTGTGVQLVATHTLTSKAHTHGFTTNGTELSHSVTAPTESTAHTHGFTGSKMYVHAAFTGTAASHNHTFTGTAVTGHPVDITVDKFTGNLTGSSAGTVNITNGKDVLTGIAINDHAISTVDSGSVTTGNAIQ